MCVLVVQSEAMTFKPGMATQFFGRDMNPFVFRVVNVITQRLNDADFTAFSFAS